MCKKSRSYTRPSNFNLKLGIFFGNMKETNQDIPLFEYSEWFKLCRLTKVKLACNKI